LTQSSKQFVFFSDYHLDVHSLASDAQSPEVSKTIGWKESEWNLVSATLKFDASQPYSSGAELYAFFNGNDLGTVIGWGAWETGPKSATVDVTGMMQNGNNSLALKYHINYPALPFQGFTAIASATLEVVLEYIGSGKPPSEPWVTTSNWVIVAGVAAAAALITALAVVLVKR
jgi:hypothetical protein